MKRLIKSIIVVIVLFSNSSKAQTFNWNVNFEQICDNREYARNIGTSETILGGRFSSEVGLNYDSTHYVFIGFTSFYEYGSTFSSQTSDIIVYYKYTNYKNINIYFGAFPRKGLLDTYPLAMISDYICYYKPTVTGGFVDYSGKFGHQDVWCDWISRQEDHKREMFLAGTSGKLQLSKFYLENYMYMFHKALPKENKDSLHIEDNGAVTAFAGLDLSNMCFLNVAKLDIGGIINYDRQRPNKFQYFKGLMARLFLEYENYGINVTQYLGDALNLPQGDPLYQNKNYTRIDLFWMPIIRNQNITSKINLALHIEDGKIGSSQQLFLYIKFASLKNRLDKMTEKFGK